MPLSDLRERNTFRMIVLLCRLCRQACHVRPNDDAFLVYRVAEEVLNATTSSRRFLLGAEISNLLISQHCIRQRFCEKVWGVGPCVPSMERLAGWLYVGCFEARQDDARLTIFKSVELWCGSFSCLRLTTFVVVTRE